MKKFLLSLGLVLILAGCGWLGCPGLGATPALAQPPAVSGYSCDPYYNECTYYNYYEAPYTDPYSQFFYYTVPEIVEEHREHENRERFREFERRREWDREHGFR